MVFSCAWVGLPLSCPEVAAGQAFWGGFVVKYVTWALGGSASRSSVRRSAAQA
jgi:hypothetical protein